MEGSIKELSRYRMECAAENLEAAKLLFSGAFLIRNNTSYKNKKFPQNIFAMSNVQGFFLCVVFKTFVLSPF